MREYSLFVNRYSTQTLGPSRVSRFTIHAYRSSHQEIAQHQPVHIGSQETLDRLFRAAHNRLVHVKRGVQEDRDTGLSRKSFEQLSVSRVFISAHSLDT